jgi:hypothetical protein
MEHTFPSAEAIIDKAIKYISHNPGIISESKSEDQKLIKQYYNIDDSSSLSTTSLARKVLNINCIETYKLNWQDSPTQEESQGFKIVHLDCQWQLIGDFDIEIEN